MGNRFGGQVLAGAAPFGLMLAAAVGVTLTVFGDLVPATTWLAPHPAPVLLRFGPFMAVGPIAYLCWPAAAAVAWRFPWYQAPAAWVCVVATVAVRELSPWGARPPSSELLLLCCLGAPAAFAPRPERSRRATSAVAVGVVALGLLALQAVWSGLRDVRFDYWLTPLYWSWPTVIPTSVAYLAAGGVCAAIGLARARRAVAAGVIALLVCMVSITAGLSRTALHIPMNASTATSLTLGSALGACLLAAWASDLRRAKPVPA